MVGLSALTLLSASLDWATIRATFGVGEVQPGTGFLLTFLAPFVAIWPLVVLWKDDRRTRTA